MQAEFKYSFISKKMRTNFDSGVYENAQIKNGFTLYWSVSKEFFAKKKSAKKILRKEKYSLKFNIFGTFCPENHHFLDILLMTITFFLNSIIKRVSLKNLSPKITNFMAYVLQL